MPCNRRATGEAYPQLPGWITLFYLLISAIYPNPINQKLQARSRLHQLDPINIIPRTCLPNALICPPRIGVIDKSSFAFIGKYNTDGESNTSIIPIAMGIGFFFINMIQRQGCGAWTRCGATYHTSPLFGFFSFLDYDSYAIDLYLV